VVGLTDSVANVVERYSYDVFGQPNRGSDMNNPYMFTGRRYDPETALYYYRARYYDYYTGRFLQPDPIGYTAGVNLYSYCSNNPVGLADPTGLIPKGEHPFAVLQLRPNALLRVKTADGRTRRYKITTGTDLVKIMINSKVTANRIVSFEYIGHADSTGGGLSVRRKKGPNGYYYTGIFTFGGTGRDTYTIDSLRGLIRDSFDPKAKLVLAACCTAYKSKDVKGKNIAEKFKEILPEAEIWGYTGAARVDMLWGLHHPKECTNSEFIEVILAERKGCQK
jgi:RHS repeat-associated protein